MSTAVDVGTLDLIENALLNARFEMDEVVRRRRDVADDQGDGVPR